jgi:tRNA U34 2-thiouridine synthase MnmA/TrmU
LPVFILSGKYGLLRPDQEIDWYDKLLEPDNERQVQELVTEQLSDEQISEVIFYAKRIDEPGWRSYHNALARACESLNIGMTTRLLT